MSTCSLTNLTSCLPELILDYLLSILNAPIEGLLSLIKYLLSEPVNVAIFHSLWGVIIYIISLFYGLFFIFAGFNLIVSSYDPKKRQKAKEWLQNTILMILFIQGSFILYRLILEFSALLSSGMIEIIDESFFLITLDSISNLGLSLVLLIPYLIILVITIILLMIRYMMVSIGIVIFPLGLFFYFIPPLQAYGRMILNVLMTAIFLPFFAGIILFGASVLLELPVYSDVKILFVASAFVLVDTFMILLIVFGGVKAVFAVVNSDVGRTVKKLK